MKKLLPTALALLYSTGLIFCKEKNYPSPLKYESSIQKFENQDQAEAPPENAIVVTGSSSVRRWENIHKDLKPLTIIHRGFGGSTMNDLYHYADRIVTNYKPRAVVIYEEYNDIGRKISVSKVKQKFLELKEKLLASNKDLRIYVISVKPSTRRQALFPQARELNDIFKEFCEGDENIFKY